MIGTHGIIFAGIISYLTFRLIVCIFTVILAGFSCFDARCRTELHLYCRTFYVLKRLFRKQSRHWQPGKKRNRKRDSQCGAGPQIRNCGKEQVGVLPNIFPSCFFKAQSRATQTVIKRMLGCTRAEKSLTIIV